MHHMDGWMGGCMGGGMWLWTVIGVLVVEGDSASAKPINQQPKRRKEN